MKNKFYSFFFTAALLMLATFTRAQVVVVQHGAAATVFSNIDSAMLAASAGDYLYLSGGLFIVHGINGTGSDSIHFYKPLHIVGAGISADSSVVTGITVIQPQVTSSNFGAILIGSGASGSTFDGLYFNCQNTTFGNGYSTPDSNSNFIFNRCQFGAVQATALSGGPNPTNLNVEFHECIINGLSELGHPSCSALVDRCIIIGQCQSLSSSVTWNNCVMGEPVGAGTINNCYMYGGNNSFVNQFGAVYNNCVLANTAPSSGSDVFNNCLFGVTDTVMFVNATTTSFYWSNDYHLAAGSPGIHFGTGGHDVGIYGTASPAKAGFVPYNPHYSSATIPSAIDANGNLNINMHVIAQPY